MANETTSSTISELYTEIVAGVVRSRTIHNERSCQKLHYCWWW